MPNLIDLTGKKYNRLTVIKRDTSRKGVYWVCLCDCGNTVTVRGWNLTSGETKSCGCLNLKKIHRKKRNFKDISGNRYGELEVLSYHGSDRNGTLWQCKCHRCGSTKVLTASWIKRYTSCGCKAKETALENVGKLHNVVNESKSNFSILKQEANSNNQTTGIRGVSYNTSSGKYVAYISYKKKRYTLLRSTDINKAIEARRIAEKHIRSDFLDWLNEYRGKSEK